MRAALIAVLFLSACSSSTPNDTPATDAAPPPKVGDVEPFAEVPSTEGIAFGNGTLYVSSAGTLHRVGADGIATKWIDVPGALGIAVRTDGHLLVCGKDDGGKGVIWHVTPEGMKSVLVGGFVQTNFVVVAPDDSIVFSDSAANLLYRANADGSAPTVITDTIVYPNGLAFSKDGKTLYVASWKGKKVLALARKSDGTYDAPTVAVDGPENVDGLAVGASGDLYLVANGLGILRARGGKTEAIAPGSSFKLAANAAFGTGAYGTTWLYVTNLIGPAVSRLYVDEGGAPLPAR